MGCSDGPGLKQFLEESSVHFFVEESKKRTGTAISKDSRRIQDRVYMGLCSGQLDPSCKYTYPLPHERATEL